MQSLSVHALCKAMPYACSACACDGIHKHLNGNSLQALRSRQDMIGVFIAAADRYLGLLHEASMDLKEIQSLFGHELTQFNHGLPTYARKQEFLRLLHEQQGIVLKGGTGIGEDCLLPFMHQGIACCLDLALAIVVTRMERL